MIGWLSVGLCVACESAAGTAGMAAAAGSSGQNLQPSAAGTSVPAEPEDPCVRAALAAPPATVTDIVDHLNTLPKPVSLPCLVSSLPGPLPLLATRSVFSAQPAVGQRSPRIFVLYEQMTLSIALDGMGKDLLEFGEHRPEQRSLKAEIEFPVAEALTHEAPFERILYKDGQSSCAFCHRNETLADDIDFTQAFVSIAYRPTDFQAAVSVSELATLRAECDAEAEPQRCAMLESLFAHGTPVDRAFPPEYATFQ